jgi:hypothetical protein
METKSAFEIEVEQPKVEDISYKQKETEYLEFLKKRLKNARDERENNRPEFNQRPYSMRYKDNMEKAFNLTEPLKNPEDTSVNTGTIRGKVETIVAAILNLNFKPEVRAYDKEDIEDEVIGEAATLMIKKSDILEDWDAKKILAFWEMTSQGNVFLEECYVDEFRMDKKKVKFEDITEKSFKSFDPKKAVKEIFSGCKRNLIPGIQMYPGSISKSSIEEQPFIFTREIIDYQTAQSLYGEWPRFKSVPRVLKETQPESIWFLDTILKENQVEVIKYQDKWNDEYQILLNGVMMLPVGFPMPWEYGEYNIVKGDLEPNHGFFFYSKGLVEKSKFEQEVYDEMFRLAVLSTQKKFMPPIANQSSSNLTKNDFLPGKVLNDVDPAKIGIVGGPYGVTNDELAMLNLMREVIDGKSVKSIVQGGSASGQQTATEITALMQQAKQQLGLIIKGFENFHRKAGLIRLYNILENWTKPLENKLDDVKGKIIAKYRTITMDEEIQGKGMGTKMVRMTEEVKPSHELYAEENGLEYPEQEGNPQSILEMKGKPKKSVVKKPKRILELNPKELRNVKYSWFIEVTPAESDTSLIAKAQFEQSLMGAMQMWPQLLASAEIQEKWARYNKMSPDVFKQSTPPPQAQPGMPTPQGMPPQSMQPKPMTPSINRMANTVGQ